MTTILSSSPEIGLSSHALAALQSFMLESAALNDLESLIARDNDKKTELSMDRFPEKWGLSQFWNDEGTAQALAQEAVDEADGGLIVCISSPSTFLALKKMDVPNSLLLLEFDERFNVFPEFRQYDYAQPLDVQGLTLADTKAAVVIVDPPYINDECFTKTAQTVRAMSTDKTKVIVGTGWLLRDTVARTLNAHIATFRPGHSGGLATPFRAYVNYTSANPVFALSTDPEDGSNDGNAFAGRGGL